MAIDVRAGGVVCYSVVTGGVEDDSTAVVRACVVVCERVVAGQKQINATGIVR